MNVAPLTTPNLNAHNYHLQTTHKVRTVRRGDRQLSIRGEGSRVPRDRTLGPTRILGDRTLEPTKVESKRDLGRVCKRSTRCNLDFDEIYGERIRIHVSYIQRTLETISYSYDQTEVISPSLLIGAVSSIARKKALKSLKVLKISRKIFHRIAKYLPPSLSIRA